jgi:alpha-tubulin suppressor-like RCC1 family protein
VLSWDTGSVAPDIVEGLPPGVAAVAAGADGARYALLAGGGVLAWGANGRGQCGAGARLAGPGRAVKAPRAVKFLETEVVALAAGDRHALAVTRRLDPGERPAGTSGGAAPPESSFMRDDA